MKSSRLQVVALLKGHTEILRSYFLEYSRIFSLAIIRKQINIGSSEIQYWLLFNGSVVNDLLQWEII